MSAQDFSAATDKPYDFPDISRQPMLRGDTGRSDIFAPLNSTTNDLNNDLGLGSSTTHKSPSDYPPTNPFAHDSASSKGLGGLGHDSSFKTSNLSGSGLSNGTPITDKIASNFEPAGKVSEGPPSTHFHNFFYDTFTWKYPRTTGTMFAGSLALLLLGHFVNILRYAFKGAWITFASVAAFEYLGRPTTGTGFMTQLRPQKYYMIPRAQLDNVFAEMHEFLNFAVLEFQRIIYVESLSLTIAAFVFSYLGYVLIKFLPIWGLVLIADIGLFTIPLVYLQNQEVIDNQMRRASTVVTEQIHTAQSVAAKHTADVTNKASHLANDLSASVTSAYQGRQKIPATAQTTTGQTTTGGKIPVAGKTTAAAPPPPGPAPTLIEPVTYTPAGAAQPAF